MGQTLTSLKKAIKNDNAENVDITEINSAFDKFDNNFVPACMIENTAVQSIPNTGLQLLQYNAIIYDTFAARSEGPMADLSNDRIIIRKTGLYTVTARIWTTTAIAAGVMFLGIYVNGNGITSVQKTPGAQQETQEVTDDLLLNSGDLVTINAIQNSGAPRNYSKNTWPHGFSFAAKWIGSAVEV